jgi:hypothetical protein
MNRRGKNKKRGEKTARDMRYYHTGIHRVEANSKMKKNQRGE